MLSRKKRKLLSYQLGFSMITDPDMTRNVCSALKKGHERYEAEWNRGLEAIPNIRLFRKSKEHECSYKQI